MGVRLTCRKCGKVMGFWDGKVKCADGYICYRCWKDMGFSDRDIYHGDVASMTTDDIKAVGVIRGERNIQRQIQSERWKFYDASYAIDPIAKFNDKRQKMLLYIDGAYTEYDYVQLMSYSIDFDSDTVNHSVQGAIVGGMFGGSTGAVVGAVAGSNVPVCTKLDVLVWFAGEKKPHTIDVLGCSSASGSYYKDKLRKAKSLLRKFEIIKDLNSSKQVVSDTGSASVDSFDTGRDSYDEIRKLKGLLDDGIITQNEFEAKKKNLLRL